MRYVLFVLLSLGLFACSEKATNEQLSSLTIVYPGQANKKVFAGTFNDYVVERFDTLYFDAEATANWQPKVDRPQFLSIKLEDDYYTFYFTPGTKLQIERDTLAKSWKFSGKDAKANNYRESLKKNETLNQYGWSTTERISLAAFIEKIDLYFKAKKGILDQSFARPEEKEAFFYKVESYDQQAFKNYALLNFIQINYSGATYDSLLAKHLDQSLLDFNATTPYLAAEYLRYLYDRYGMEYFGAKEFGPNWRIFRSELGPGFKMKLAVTHFPSPIRQILVRNTLHNLLADPVGYPTDLPSIPYLLDQFKPELVEGEYDLLLDKLASKLGKGEKYAKGQSLPALNLLDKDSLQVSIRQETEGKYLLYDIWASWCGPCIKSFPEVKKLQSNYADQLKVLSISVDENFGFFKNGLEKNEVPGDNHLWAPDGFDSDFAKYFQLIAIPKYLLIDPDHSILEYNSLDKIEEALKEI